MHTVLLGIGSNLGNPEKTCRQAIDLVSNHAHIRVSRVASLYRTEPVGVSEQGWFVNTVMECVTALSAEALLEAILEIERTFGRVRTERWGPRTLDLDILFYDDLCLKCERLTVPHPRLHERRFVLVPLVELAPQRMHPVLGKTIQQLLSALPSEGQVVERLGSP